MDKQQFLYVNGHQWLSIEDGEAFLGITYFGQRKLTAVSGIYIHCLNRTLRQGKFMGSIESANAILEIFMPVSGTVVEINAEVLKNPGLLNNPPYHIWLVKIRLAVAENKDRVPAAGEYGGLIRQLKK